MFGVCKKKMTVVMLPSSLTVLPPHAKSVAKVWQAHQHQTLAIGLKISCAIHS
jgi:hypothetical protein